MATAASRPPVRQVNNTAAAANTHKSVSYTHLDVYKRQVLGDVVDVVTSLTLPSVYRGRFLQRVERDGEVLFEATVDIVCLNREQSLVEFPREIAELTQG